MTDQVDTPEEMAQQARDAIESRDGMSVVEIKESQPRHALVVVEQATSDGGSETILYRIEWVSSPDGEETLNWVDLGSAE